MFLAFFVYSTTTMKETKKKVTRLWARRNGIVEPHVTRINRFSSRMTLNIVQGIKKKSNKKNKYFDRFQVQFVITPKKKLVNVFLM